MKKVYIIVGIIIIVIVISFLIGKKIIDKKYEECNFFTGGSFNLIFNVNGGEEIPIMSICIACSPDSYEELPVPIRKGYSFDGWYYDKDLTKKIDFTNTIDFSPIPEYDKHKCHVGYKDIEIYAKWNK